MAKSKFEIIGSVRVGRTLYRSGMEEELQAKASPEQLQRLAEKGVVSGVAPARSEPTEGDSKSTSSKK
jgi:hypothetical protein